VRGARGACTRLQRHLDRRRPQDKGVPMSWRIIPMLTKSLGAGFALLAATVAASGQNYPTKPMTMIVPFAAGGPQDVIGRILAQRLSEVLGQQVVIENIGGAGGMTGSRRVADAPPDGYTFGLGSVGTHAQNQTLFKQPLYDAATDFAPVA